jgi:hypothetical protein
VWIAREMGRRAKLLETVGRKLVVGYRPTTNPKGWDAFNSALIAAGATRNNVSHVMTTCYPTGELNSIKALSPFMERGDRPGVITALLKDLNTNAAPRFGVARGLAEKLGVPWSVYEGNVAHLNTSPGHNTCVPFVEAVQKDPSIRVVGERLVLIAENEGCDVLNVFNFSSGASRNGFFGVKGTPFGKLLDEMRLRQRRPSGTASIAEQLWALACRVDALEGERRSSPLV